MARALQQQVAMEGIGDGDHVGEEVAEDQAGDGKAEYRQAMEPIRFGEVEILPRTSMSQGALSFGGTR
jgi:hypothetical protein